MGRTSVKTAILPQADIPENSRQGSDPVSVTSRLVIDQREPAPLQGLGLVLLELLSDSLFLTKDPISFEGGRNLYSYANQNPVKYLDPWGLSGASWIPMGQKWFYYNTALTQTGDPADHRLALLTAKFLMENKADKVELEVQINFHSIAFTTIVTNFTIGVPRAEGLWSQFVLQSANPDCPTRKPIVTKISAIAQDSFFSHRMLVGDQFRMETPGYIHFNDLNTNIFPHAVGHMLGVADKYDDPGKLMHWTSGGTTVSPEDSFFDIQRKVQELDSLSYTFSR